MRYRVMYDFTDRAQNQKLVRAGELYPPDGVDVPAHWLAHLAAFKNSEGKRLLKPMRAREAAPEDKGEG